MTFWFDNRFIPDDRPILQANDRALLGDGVFDTMLAVDGRPARGAAHMGRLLRHAALIDIEIPYSADQLLKVATELLKIDGRARGYHTVKTIITMGPGARGLDIPEDVRPSCVMMAAPAPSPETLPPVRAILSKTVRRNEHSPLSRIKALGYTDNRLARQEARRRGADDAIILNTSGNVACASTANVFVLQGDHLITPPLGDGAIDGIVRAALLDRANVFERSIAPRELLACNGIYLTNSITGVRSVVELDGKTVDSEPVEAARLFPFF
ncbi:MAG: 2-keto-4-methylthiobutyrate aminotransferase [Alphaproteobacteria bacterium]|nr:2-keto-4-methylthiobutyrate aminotransferase [Alphaproteobacteria bacterium]